MAQKPAGLLKRGTVWYARFFIPADQQARLGKEDISWSTKTGDIREAPRRLPTLQAKFEALIAPPDPRREDLGRRFGIPAGLPAGEALQRLQSVIAAGQAADSRRWAIDRQQAALVDPVDFGLDIDKPEPPAPTEADRLAALFDHRAEDREFQAAAAAAGLVPERIAPAEAVAAQLVAEQPKQTKSTASTSVTWDQLRQAWELERKLPGRPSSRRNRRSTCSSARWASPSTNW